MENQLKMGFGEAGGWSMSSDLRFRARWDGFRVPSSHGGSFSIKINVFDNTWTCEEEIPRPTVHGSREIIAAELLTSRMHENNHRIINLSELFLGIVYT